MKRGNPLFLIIILLFGLVSCNQKKTAIDILNNTISSLDTIETIYYKQDMSRTNPRNTNETIQRHREMFFKRLVSDSIVGVKGHWYMYVNNKEDVIFEDIYDGNKLIRKNNRDSVVRIYDLVKYPEFKNKHFWSHNTLHGMQYEFKYILNNLDSYTIDRLNDTIVDEKICYQIQVNLVDKITMPGFSTRLEDEKGQVSKTRYYIDNEKFYPVKIRGESYTMANPKHVYFIDQRYYDIKFNLKISEDVQFDTSNASFAGFEQKEMQPD